MVWIALDAMGGDFAPRVPVQGALEAVRHHGCQVILVGHSDQIAQELARQPYNAQAIRVHHASQRIEDGESPLEALRHNPENALSLALKLVQEGQAQAVVSAGHSGAMMVAGKLVLGTLPGLERPAIATHLPLKRGFSLLLDSGANVDCKPRYLVQFAHMGELYMRVVRQIPEPRVALLSNGSEPGKGNDLVRQAHELLTAEALRYVGYVEGRDLFRGKADVLVTDGFAGNLVLKAIEAMANQFRLLHKEARTASWLGRVGYWLLEPLFREFDRRTDFRQIGGSLLLGLNAPAVVCHGASNARAVHNAILVARDCALRGLVPAMAQGFSEKD